MLPAQMKKVLSVAGANLVNYDYIDIANGTGVTNFYGGQVNRGGSSSYSLTANTFYSQKTATRESSAASQSIFTKTVEVSFETQFNLPRTMNGQIICNIPAGLQVGTGTIYAYVHVFAEKYSGASSWALDNSSGAIFYKSGAGNQWTMEAIPLYVSKTTFKKGDKFKIRVQLWDYPTETSRVYSGAIGHDPMNRVDYESSGAVFTQMIVKVPFILDI